MIKTFIKTFNRISWTEWPEVKKKLTEDGTLPFGTLPLLEHNGKKYVQSLAIMRYLGRTLDLFGKNDEEQVVIDIVVEGTDDLRRALYHNLYEVTDEETKKKFKKDSERETTLPHYLYYFDKLKAKNEGDYFVGDKVSIADICVFDIVSAVNEFDPDCYDNYEHIKSFMDHFSKLPKYVEYAKSDRRPKEP